MIPNNKLAVFISGLLMLMLTSCLPRGGGPLPGTGVTPAVTTAPGSTQSPGTPAAVFQTQPPGASDPLENTQWTLVSFGQAGTETPVLQGANLTLDFDGGMRASGFSGCNSFGAGYRVLGSKLSLEQIVSTLKACSDGNIMDQEQRYLKALQSAGEFTISGNQLMIQSENGQGTLLFTRSQAGTPAATQAVTPGTGNALTNTQWKLESFGPISAANPVVAGSSLTIEFDPNGQAGGSGGCNTYGAGYQVQGNTISFENIVSTERACLDQGLTQQEQSYFQALQGASSFEINGDRLVIHNNNGQFVLNFVNSKATGLLCSPDVQPVTPEWNLCQSVQYGFEVQYPQAGVLADQTGTTARINLPFTPGTNLTEKYLDISISEGATTCSSPLAAGHDPGTIPTEHVVVNNITFTKETGQDGAAGSTYNWVAYSDSPGNVCVSLSFVLRSHQPDLEPTPPPVYDADEESKVFNEILATFRWLNPPATPAAPQATSTPVPVPATGTSTPVPATAAPASLAAERIRFRAGGTSATVEGRLPASGSDQYVLSASAGQALTINLSFTRGRGILVVWGADGDVLLSDHAEAPTFSGVLPRTQDYYIMVKGRPNGVTVYSMQVTIPPLAGTAVPATPVPVRVRFGAGATSDTVRGNLPASGSQVYVIAASRGQTMSVDLSFTRGKAILAVWGADGDVLMSDHAEASSFSGVLPKTQDYYILVRGRPNGATDYGMTVTIPPLP